MARRAYAGRRRRRYRNPAPAQAIARRTTTTYQARGGMFASTEGKVMLVGGLVLVAVVGYFLLEGSGS